MFKRGHPGERLPLALLPIALLVASLGWVLTASTSAATVTPESTANCYGSLTPAPDTALDEPNSLNYKFSCDSRTTAYTIFVDRGDGSSDTIDDFNTAPEVFLPDGVTPNAKVAWTCEGSLPSSGFNCNTGGGTTYMGAWNLAEGSFDPTEPYCKSLPAGAKPGTGAIPQALVQLVVTDSTGAQDGPFTLGYTAKCKTVPNTVPKPKAKKKTTKKTTKKGTKR